MNCKCGKVATKKISIQGIGSYKKCDDHAQTFISGLTVNDVYTVEGCENDQ